MSQADYVTRLDGSVGSCAILAVFQLSAAEAVALLVICEFAIEPGTVTAAAVV